MASKFYPNQAGTTNSTFDIGLGKLRLDSSNLTAQRTLTFPDSNGTTGQLLKTDGSGNLSWSNVAISEVPGLRAELDTKSYNSTGLISGGTVSINVDNTKFNVAAGTAIFVDYTTPLAPVATTVSFGPFTAVTPTSLATALVTYVGINSSGGLVQQTSPFTNTQRRTIVSLGSIVHSNHVIINTTNYICSSARTDINQIGDVMTAIGPLNIGGNEYGPNGANLNINKTSGTVFKFGSNFPNNDADPHTLALSGGTAVTFRYRTATGGEGSDITAIDPNTYESPAGTVIAVPNGKFTVQRITLFSSGATRIQRGQTLYGSMSEALAGFATETFQTETNISENGILRCLLILEEGTTDLSDPLSALFLHAGKFGSVASGGTALTSSNITAALGYTPADDALVVHNTGGTIAGNLSFSGTGRRITADLSNATHANRLLFQTTTTNGSSTIGVLPNGTGVGTALNLYAVSDTTNTALLQIGSNNTTAYLSAIPIGSGASVPLAFSTGGSERLRVLATAPIIQSDTSNASFNNRFAIQDSVTNGATSLEAIPNGTGPHAQLRLYNNSDRANASAIIIKCDATQASITSANSGTGSVLPLTFTANGERMRIDTGGNVCFGTTNPADPLSVRIDGIVFNATQKAMYSRGGAHEMGTNSTSGIHINFFTDNGTAAVNAGTISSNGSTTSFNTSSDYRLKTNAQPLEFGLDFINQIQFKSWTWQSDGRRGEGAFAHELQELENPIPDAVQGEKDAVKDDGTPLYQSADYSKLIPRMGRAIQQLSSQLDSAVALITDLQQRIAVLEAQ